MPTIVEVNREQFQSAQAGWTWQTPGTSLPELAWSHGLNATPTQSGGPGGGAEPPSGLIRQGNGFAFTEATDSGGPWSLESPELDAGSGRLELTFDLHMRFGAEGGIDDGRLSVQGWNGQAWSTIGRVIEGSQQHRASDPYKSSERFGTYDSRDFGNAGFKFRILFSKGESEFSGNYDCAVDNVRIVRHAGRASTAVKPDFNALRTIWVDPVHGRDNASGFGEDKAKASLKAALSMARGGDLIRVKDGVFFSRHELRNKNGSKDKPIWIRAENPGKVVITNRWQQAFDRSLDWKPAGDGVFKAKSPSGDGPFMGSYVDDHGIERFLFKYRTKADITRNPLRIQQNAQPDFDLKNPAYGFSKVGDQIFLRLRNGTDPKNSSIRLTKDFGKNLLVVNRSQHVIVDGITFEGSGKADAIICTPQGDPKASSHLTIRNCIFEHCRRAAALHNHAHVEWCEYLYPGFRDWMNGLLRKNDVPGAIFALCKNHFNDGGNAFLEGGWAENMQATPSHCLFEYNFTHDVFEGHRLGAFIDSTIRFEAADGIGDDWVEFEHHKGRSSKNNRIIACKVLNCHASFISAQDKSGKIAGPNYVSRCIFDSTDDALCHPPYVIKNQGLKKKSYKLHVHNCFIRNPGGGNAGFGGQNFFWWDSTKKDRNPDRLRLRNNLVVFDRGKLTGGSADRKPVVSNNLLVNDANRRDVTGNGGRFLGRNASALGLAANYKLQLGSPAIGTGSSTGLTGPAFVGADVGFGGGDFRDAGPFPKGFDPGPEWPRPFRRSFSPNPIPERWPFAS